MNNLLGKWIISAGMALAISHCNAQDRRVHRKGEFYLSWGYNKDWYTKSTVKISQPDLGNKYQFKSVTAHDHPGWDEGLTLFKKGGKGKLFIPSVMAYGPQGSPPVIPGNSNLIFTVEIVNVKASKK